MSYSTTTYQLIKKSKDLSEKVILETDASTIERAMDYFYMVKPKSYGNQKYSIRIKKRETTLFYWFRNHPLVTDITTVS